MSAHAPAEPRAPRPETRDRCPAKENAYHHRMRKLIGFVIVLALIVGGVYVAAGRLPGPAVQLVSPDKYVGAASSLEVVATVPAGAVSSLRVTFEQNGTETPLVAYTGATGSAGGARITQEDGGRLRAVRTIDRDSVPGLKSGPARLVVTATRPVVYGLRRIETRITRDLTVRLERPRLTVISTHHYINLGGSEMIVYRVAPDDVESGVSVGGIEYPGYPASGATVDGVTIKDPAVRVAFFALLYDQDLDVPIHLYARDEAGNGATAEFEHRTFPKPVRNSRIVLTDRFIDRVVPAILAGTTEVAPQGSTIDQYVVLNRDLRKKNAATIASFAAKTSPEMLWRGVVFHSFTNSAVESAFADRRTYVYQGRDVDHEVHLGFDLASVAHAPVLAANRGRVLYAAELGIYGNCVIIDHGMGVQSLYGHLSSLDVKAGDMVEKEQPLGHSGMTGLAGGDHLHFTMLVNGQMVNPVEWWDPHWIQDRILRKLRAVD